jgi:cell division protein FtsI/penicillin-binding protein 2
MSLKEIRLIRLLMWVLFYLVLLFALIFAVVVPAVKAYKSANKEYAEQKARYLAAKNDHDTIFDRLKTLRSKNRKALQAFTNHWDEKRFVETAKKYFNAVEMVPVDVNESDVHYRIYEINAKAKMESPQNFYKFLEALPGIPYVIQADFPIAFRSNGRDEIEGIFRIRVYEERKPSKESNASRQPATKR